MFGTDAELAFMLQDAGEAVRFGGRSTFGSLSREPLQVPTDRGVVVDGWHTTLEVRANDPVLAAVVVDSVLTVDGVRYKVRDRGVVLPSGMRTYVLAEA